MSDIIRSAQLEEYIKNYKVYIDTCSLLDENSEKFWAYAVPVVRQYNRPIFVVWSAVAELKRHARDTENPELSNRAKLALAKMQELQSEKIIEVIGDSRDGTFADNVYHIIFTRDRMMENLLLITQDNNLARDILKLKESQSVTRIKDIAAKRINFAGVLDDYSWNSRAPRTYSSGSVSGTIYVGKRSKNWPLRLTVVVAVVAAIVLFIYRWDIMEFAFHGSSFAKDKGFIFNFIYPMILLYFPWAVASVIIYGVFSLIGDKIKYRKRKKHRVLKTILLILVLLIIGVFVYDHFYPGFIQSIPTVINQTVEKVSGLLKADNQAQTTSGQETADEKPLITDAPQQPDKQAPVADNAKQTDKQEPVSDDRQQTEEQSNAKAYVVTRTDGLVLHTEANARSNAVTRLKKGETVYTVDENIVQAGNKEWRKVKTQKNITGWAIVDFMKETDSDNTTGKAEAAPQKNQSAEGSTTYSDMTFMVKKTGSSKGTLTIQSNTSETWKLAPWVGHSSTVTLTRVDGSTAYAEISTSNMFFKYHTKT